jgi:hypothetical protein
VNNRLFAATVMALVIPPAALPIRGQEGPDISAVISRRIAELRAELEREIATNVQPAGESRQALASATVQALAAIVKQERDGGNRGAVYQQALQALANFPDHHVAVRALVENIDEPPSPAPILTRNPLEHFPAATALLRCGTKARSQILLSLDRPHSDRELHIKALVLAQLDQARDFQPFDVEVTVLRLARAVKRISDQPGNSTEAAQTAISNLQRMTSMLLDPGFAVADIPRP